jgi:threonine/homoserine/homoserine lactone efflux protein
MANGFRRSLLTAGGDLTANLLQMLAAGLGLAALLMSFEQALTIIKWAGACYLVWLGLKMISNAKRHGGLTATGTRTSLKKLWLQGFITSATNPKAVVFFAALFPQFIDPQQSFWPQFISLSTTYIVLDGLFLSVYAASAARLAARFDAHGRMWLDRIGGSFMIVAAILLALKTARQA